MGYIRNDLDVAIMKKELYSGLYEYSLPYGYYFESYGQSYGNLIYAREIPDNNYIVRKMKNGGLQKADTNN